MEALWTFPLLIIFPLIGFILIFIGIVRIRNGESRKTLYFGISFFSFPLLYLMMSSIFQFGLEKNIQGSYSIGNEKAVLIINEDRTFTLKNSATYMNSGTGTWEMEQIDFPILKLDFNSPQKGELWLEIKNNNENISLSSMSWGNDIITEFVKEAHSR